MSHFSIISHSAVETRSLAADIAKHLQAGDIVGLSGSLGAGKTEFVRGVCEAYGVADQVSSPSYVLQAIYDLDRSKAPFQIQHWDLYRLSNKFSAEIYEEIQTAEQDLVFIEWAERQPEVEDLLGVKILLDFPPQEMRESEQSRVISVQVQAGHGLEAVLERMGNNFE